MARPGGDDVDARINLQAPPEGQPPLCYHTALKSCFETAGCRAPRWLLTCVAGVNHLNYFQEDDENGERAFEGLSFTDSSEILESTAGLPGIWGFESHVVSGLGWSESRARLIEEVDRGRGILLGPFDSHYMRSLNLVHFDWFRADPGVGDHFFSVTGHDADGIYLSDNNGYCHAHLDWDTVRQGWGSLTYFYAVGRDPEQARREATFRLVVVDEWRRRVTDEELARAAVERTRQHFLAGEDFRDERTSFIYGPAAIEALAAGCEAAFHAPRPGVLRAIVTELYKVRTGPLWGHQLRAWHAYLWHWVGAEGLAGVDPDIAGRLSRLFFESSQAWLAFHRHLRAGYDALYEKNPIERFGEPAPDMAREARRAAAAEAEIAGLLRDESAW